MMNNIFKKQFVLIATLLLLTLQAKDQPQGNPVATWGTARLDISSRNVNDVLTKLAEFNHANENRFQVELQAFSEVGKKILNTPFAVKEKNIPFWELIRMIVQQADLKLSHEDDKLVLNAIWTNETDCNIFTTHQSLICQYLRKDIFAYVPSLEVWHDPLDWIPDPDKKVSIIVKQGGESYHIKNIRENDFDRICWKIEFDLPYEIKREKQYEIVLTLPVLKSKSIVQLSQKMDDELVEKIGKNVLIMSIPVEQKFGFWWKNWVFQDLSDKKPACSLMEIRVGNSKFNCDFTLDPLEDRMQLIRLKRVKNLTSIKEPVSLYWCTYESENLSFELKINGTEQKSDMSSAIQ